MFAVMEIDTKRVSGRALGSKISLGDSKILLGSPVPPSYLRYKAPADNFRHFVSFCYLESNKENFCMSLFQAKFPFNLFLVTFIMEWYLLFGKYIF